MVYSAVLHRFANTNLYYFMILSTPSLAGDFYLNFFMGCVVEIPAYIVAVAIIKYMIPEWLLVSSNKFRVVIAMVRF